MWVLYNNDGQVITSIPHGEVARQGSSITVYIAFEKEYFHNILGQQSLIYSRTEFINAILSKIVAQAQFDSFEPVLVTPQLYKFKRIKDNESICSFEEGKTYVVYKFDGGSQYTVDYGDHNLNLTFDFVENGNIVDSQTFGTIPIFLEKTYGGTVQDNVIPTEKYQLLLAKVQEMLTTKLNIEDEKVWLIEETQPGENKFAAKVLDEVSRHNEAKIYFGSIATNAANKRTVVGIYQKSSGENYVLILEGNGSIKVSNGQTLTPVKFANLQADLFGLTNGTATNLTILQTLNAKGATITINEPALLDHPTTRKYVDEIRDTLQGRINGIEAAQNLLDIVANKSKLESWKTDNPDAKLQKNDKIKVLEDKDYGNSGTYYKWNGQSWEYIGKDGIYYTQTEVDTIKNNLQVQIDYLKTLINVLISSNVSYKEE